MLIAKALKIPMKHKKDIIFDILAMFSTVVYCLFTPLILQSILNLYIRCEKFPMFKIIS